MKNVRLIFPLLVIFILAIVVLNVAAQSDIPEGVQIFYLEAEGLTCLLWPDGSGDCYCPCDPVCPEPVETPTPESSATPKDDPTPTPQDSPTPPPPTPTPEEKAKCNRGIGNLDEGCDPGNSSGQGQGGGRRAGEDRDEPHGP